MATKANGDATAVEDRTVHDFDALVAEQRATMPPEVAFHIKGKRFRILSPLDWSDELIALQVAAQQNPQAADVVGMSRQMLGDNQYDEFVAAGGSAMKLNAILPTLMGGAAGESPAS